MLSLTIDYSDWFRLETLDDSFQPTIDMLLNVAVFIWFGAVCPWYSFAHNNVIPIYRLIFLGILILLLRRPPIIFAMHKKIHQIEEVRQAGFVGFFGPIGVSAIFYLYVSLGFLRNITVDGEVREDARTLMEAMNIIIWFLTICSIVSTMRSDLFAIVNFCRSFMVLAFHWGNLDITSPGQSRPPSVNEMTLNRSIFTNTLLRERMRWQHHFVINQERSHPTAALPTRPQDYSFESGVLSSEIKSRGQQIRLLEIHQLVLGVQ